MIWTAMKVQAALAAGVMMKVPLKLMMRKMKKMMQ